MSIAFARGVSSWLSNYSFKGDKTICDCLVPLTQALALMEKVMLLKQTAIAASFAVLLIGCATTVETLSSDAVSSDAYNKIMAAQGHDHYCASGVCDTAPALLSARAPAYPAHALAAGKSGQASVIFDIDARGIPENISLESATAPEFGEASLEAVKSWRYKPATLDSRAVKYERVRQTFPFQPRG